jgi:N-acetylmuramoyl-L-alanine amidase
MVAIKSNFSRFKRVSPVFTSLNSSCMKEVMLKIGRHFVIVSMLSIALVMIMAGLAKTAPAASVDIVGLRTGQVEIEGLTGGQSEAVRLVVETSHKVEVSMFLLTEPYRLVLDLPRSGWDVPGRGPEGRLDQLPLKSYRLGKPRPGVTRLVFDLDSPAAPVRAFRLPADERGHRFVVDILDRGETAFKLASAALLRNRDKPLKLGQPEAERGEAALLTPKRRPANLNSASLLPKRRPEGLGSTVLLPKKRPDSFDSADLLPKRRPDTNSGTSLVPLPRPEDSGSGGTVIDDLTADIPAIIKAPSYAEKKSKWIVFIDAGHGGKDPGAIGVSGLHEKRVTLKAAKELARQLNATGRVKAVLSRDRDVFHKLRHRINLARREKADIFISLHADAAHTKKARGVSVFTLSDQASDKEAALLASRENKADLIGGPDLDTTDPQITTALLGMFQRESMNQSAVLAMELTAGFEGLPTPRRGHRFAGFAVLKSPDIPSVLIEMGFLTNSRDEANLKSDAYIRDLMSRITTSVLRYFDLYS